jgi:hypothetical protein
MGWHEERCDDTSYSHCVFRRQPETADEVERPVRAMHVSSVEILRYRGADPGIRKRLHDIGMGRLKRKVDPELCLCVVTGELLVFNLHFGLPKDEPLPDPLPDPAGISVHVRNLTFWGLPSIDGWERVSAMLSHASFDERSFDDLQSRCYDHTVDYFEALAKRA